jgi:hypothetical protein
MLIKRASKLNMQNIEVFLFGKYQDKSVKHVLQTDPNYIIWVKKNTNKLFSENIEKEINRLNLI